MSKGPIISYQIRAREKTYQLLRKEAFRLHKPITEILDEMVAKYFSK